MGCLALRPSPIHGILAACRGGRERFRWLYTRTFRSWTPPGRSRCLPGPRAGSWIKVGVVSPRTRWNFSRCNSGRSLNPDRASSDGDSWASPRLSGVLKQSSLKRGHPPPHWRLTPGCSERRQDGTGRGSRPVGTHTASKRGCEWRPRHRGRQPRRSGSASNRDRRREPLKRALAHAGARGNEPRIPMKGTPWAEPGRFAHGPRLTSAHLSPSNRGRGSAAWTSPKHPRDEQQHDG